MTKLVVIAWGALALGACVMGADDAGTTDEALATIEPDAGAAADDTPLPSDPTLVTPLKLAQALTVTRAGAGAGVVVSSPAGITCGATCTASFRYGTIVTLTAAPQTGSTFVGWSGACTGIGACAVAMTAPQSVVATFAPILQPLSVTVTGSGSGTVVSSPAGVACGAACTAAFPSGTLVTLTAAPATGATFAGWGGACAGTATCTVAMNGPVDVTATFTLLLEPITVTATGDGSGVIVAAPTGQVCAAPGPCTILAPFGTAVTLSAQPATGSMFAGWSGPCAGTAACTLVATAPIAVGAELDRATYTLTVQTSTAGTVTGAGISCGFGGATCSVTLPRGTPVDLTFTGRATSRYCATEGYVSSGCDDYGGGCTLVADHDATVAISWLTDCWWY